MPLLGFDTQFAEKVESGAKTCTIRLPRKRPIQVGDRLYLYTGLRHPGAQKLGEGIVTNITDLRRIGPGEWFARPHVGADGVWVWQHRPDLHALAAQDGFVSFSEFDGWFNRYPVPTDLQFIHWRKVKEGES